ncbi:PspC domain-containing protein [Enterococcus sp. DIV0242_7C1]|uniref:PspC domain-containing protein n=2 Tax=Enterococcus TaxID=1350 RepID=A0A200J8K5_9ENTE|nr:MULTISPECIES: PspC domain-containing protein [Enterococcus]MBO0471917.1 PspC domain-containing protein [Enterococcus sp. DIV0242_7C1]MCA5013290.1 PspC domain-containing protein [Enterococcus sp. S23]MCA5016540.1 PspC domain-containing protein [Enterococcus sp. S22(2020)]OUZ33514.1 PspC domain-containing protein [Enterococcus sp. 9D6_DIV0238]GGC86389.1 PspC family transcriptional regulator [Enterococcus wangshanyuanii]
MKRPLTKSSNNVVLTGSLAGIAEWIGVDPTIVRVIYVILAIFSAGFPGFLLYIALAVLLPSGRRNNQGGYGHQNPYNRNTRNPNPYANGQKPRKNAEKVDDDDWSDF